MTTEADTPNTLKELYDSIATEESASYSVWLKKIKRLAKDNVRTRNNVMRTAGLQPPKRKAKSKPMRHSFLAYDGEGWGTKYVLLANSLDESISNPEGLTSKECLDFLATKYDSTVYRVFFSFGYDVNHIVKDFSDDEIEELLAGGIVTYAGHRVRYIPSKLLQVDNYNFYDVFSFFATSFIRTVTMMLGPDAITDSLTEGKSARGTFETWQMDKIIAYNKEELELLIKVCEKLQEALEFIGVYLSDWYGPGAIAKAWFSKYNVVVSEKHTRGSINALMSAYYGGRFEQTTLGYTGKIYQYDIRSAYPSVMVDMPNFRSWRHKAKGEFEHNKYSIWYISFDLRANWTHKIDSKVRQHNFMPLPVRGDDGRVCFPMVGKGWYWYSEIKVMLDFFGEDAKVTFHEGYVAETDGQPFAWVKELYDYRQQLKSEKNQAQYAIKVGLNSLYGKTAQRAGRSKYYSMAWAGYITSTVRSQLARAGYANSAAVLGFATDSIFTNRRFSLPLSTNLGDWEEQEYAHALFFQSGVYRLIRANGTIEDRYRGSHNRIGIDDLIDQIKRYPSRYPRVKMVRFISNLLAIKAPQAYGPHRLKFIPVVHELKLDAPYKRHYGFATINRGTHQMHTDFRRLLRQPITSDPKVYVGDNDISLTWDYRWGHKNPRNVESRPAGLRDDNLQKLLEDALLQAEEAGYVESSELEEPIVEDLL